MRALCLFASPCSDGPLGSSATFPAIVCRPGEPRQAGARSMVMSARRLAQRARRRAPGLLAWSALVLPLLSFSGAFLCGRPVSLWRSDARSEESSVELAATAIKKKTGSALTKRVPPPSVKVTKLKKGERYRGYINPKLKALVEAQEYRNVVDLLDRLETKGMLDRLLISAEVYWKDLNIFEISAL
ncbi:unnamed protein product, partial [Effrenium voratum]